MFGRRYLAWTEFRSWTLRERKIGGLNYSQLQILIQKKRVAGLWAIVPAMQEIVIVSNAWNFLTLQGKFEGSKPSPEDNQKARKQRLHEYCLTHVFNEKPKEEELQYIAVDDKHKIILFCALQKVASTTWLQLLKNVLGIKGSRWSAFSRFSEYSEEERSFKLKTLF